MCSQLFTAPGGFFFPYTFTWYLLGVLHIASWILGATLDTHWIHAALERVGCKVDALKEIYNLFL